ncbi:unnamed protein product [Linum trigynum]|uniref:Uncharacterized protein n=1 Tax=Linum trigynum TaxID=586398 RepID=A0AAV2FYC3_9ROSI
MEARGWRTGGWRRLEGGGDRLEGRLEVGWRRLEGGGRLARRLEAMADWRRGDGGLLTSAAMAGWRLCDSRREGLRVRDDFAKTRGTISPKREGLAVVDESV